MEYNEKLVQTVTAAVITVLNAREETPMGAFQTVSAFSGCSLQSGSEDGAFAEVDSAVAAARQAYEKLAYCSLEKRGEMIQSIRDKIRENVGMLAKAELEETGFGRLEHKMAKLYAMLEKTPGIEDVMPEITSGDFGMTITERRSFGVTACITPSTAPVGTVVHNAICMIAAGNAAVISPHPCAMRTTLKTVRLVNQAIAEVSDLNNIITVISNASTESAGNLMHHPDVDMIVATGGPAVVKAALSSGKKAVGAGAGNPPCLVDETADLKKAAVDIINGNSHENGINCVGEKALIVVRSIADQLISELTKKGGYLIRGEQIDKLIKLITLSNGMVNKEYIGKNADIILRNIGIEAGENCRTILFEAPADHVMVMEEFLMPILAIVRVNDFEEGTALAMKVEGGRRHTAVIHSKNIDHMARYAKLLATSILVKNGSSYNGAGIEGEGTVTLTVAGPTGDGITTPRTFTRPMRCALVGNVGLRSAL